MDIKKIVEAVQEAVREAVLSDQTVWDELYNAIQSDLEQSRCWLTFHDAKPGCLVSLGNPGTDCCHLIEPTIAIEAYEIRRPRPSAEQLGDIGEQIAGIERFVEQLAEAKQELQDALQAAAVDETAS
jgi:hypothetical protein